MSHLQNYFKFSYYMNDNIHLSVLLKVLYRNGFIVKNIFVYSVFNEKMNHWFLKEVIFVVVV